MLLIIDTSSKKSLIVKVLKKDFQKKAFGSNFDHSEKLLLEINKLFTKKDLAKIEGIIVVSGPGSYTGLRVGIATANALSYSLEIPAVGIDRIEWLAFQAKDFKKKNICGIVSAIHDQVFAGFYNFNNKGILIQRGNFFTGGINGLCKKINKKTLFMVEKKEELEKIINEKTLQKSLVNNFLEINFINFLSDKSIENLIELSYDKLKKGKKEAIVTPLYIKKPNIT